MRVLLFVLSLFCFVNLYGQSETKNCAAYGWLKKNYKVKGGNSSDLIIGNWKQTCLVKKKTFLVKKQKNFPDGALEFKFSSDKQMEYLFSDTSSNYNAGITQPYRIHGQTLSLGTIESGSNYVVLHVDENLLVLRLYEIWRTTWGNNISSIWQNLYDETEKKNEILIFERQP